MSSSPEVSAVIVNYNSREFLADAIGSIHEAPELIELIVVDNGSPEGPPRELVSGFRKARLLETGVNLGFGRAANIGARAAKGEFVALVNPDVAADSGVFGGLLEVFDEHPDAGGVSPQALYPDGTRQPMARRFPDLGYLFFGRRSPLSRLFPRNPVTRSFLYEEAPGDVVRVDALIGTFLLLRRRTFLGIGGFDERFFFSAEDVDLAKRLSVKGLGMYLAKGVRVVHYYGGARRSALTRSEFYRMKSFYHYYRKHNGLVRHTGLLFGLGLAGMTALLGLRGLFGVAVKEPSWA